MPFSTRPSSTADWTSTGHDSYTLRLASMRDIGDVEHPATQTAVNAKENIPDCRHNECFMKQM